MVFPNKKYMKRTIRRSAPISRLQKDVRMLKRVAIPEIKFLDTTISFTSVISVLQIAPVSLMAQGDTDSTRDGDEVLLKNLYWKGILSNDVSAGSSTPTLTRILIVQDNQQDSDSVVFTVTDLLQTEAIDSYYKADGNHKRFKVLYDKVHSTNVFKSETDLTKSGMDRKWITKSHKLNRKLYFNGTAATQASQGRGKLYFCAISDHSGLGSDMEFQARLTYQDS